jgi:hypothetical protein
MTTDRIDNALARTGARLCVIDYFQLLRGADAGRDRVSDLDGLMVKIKHIAIRRRCAILMVSEVAKSITKNSRAGRFGRGSAAVDYGCYNLFYGDYATRKPNPDKDGTIAVLWRCIKLKGRRKRNLTLRFHGATQTFYDPNPVILPAPLADESSTQIGVVS